MVDIRRVANGFAKPADSVLGNVQEVVARWLGVVKAVAVEELEAGHSSLLVSTTQKEGRNKISGGHQTHPQRTASPPRITGISLLVPPAIKSNVGKSFIQA